MNRPPYLTGARTIAKRRAEAESVNRMIARWEASSFGETAINYAARGVVALAYEYAVEAARAGRVALEVADAA